MFLNLLKVTHVILMNYVKSGKIQAIKMANGLYDYDCDGCCITV